MFVRRQIDIILPFALSYVPYFLAYFFSSDSVLLEYIDFKYLLDLLVIILAFGFSQMLFKVDRKSFVVGALKFQFYVALAMCISIIFFSSDLVWIVVSALLLTIFQIERNMYLRLSLTESFYKVLLIQNSLIVLGFLLWFLEVIDNVALAYSLGLLIFLFYSRWLRMFFRSNLGEYKITRSNLWDLFEGMFSQAIFIAIPFTLNKIAAWKGMDMGLRKELTLHIFYYMSTFFPANIYGAKIISYTRKKKSMAIMANYMAVIVMLSIVLLCMSILLIMSAKLYSRLAIVYMLFLGSIARAIIPVNIANGKASNNLIIGLFEVSILSVLFATFNLSSANTLSIMLIAVTFSFFSSLTLILKLKNE